MEVKKVLYEGVVVPMALYEAEMSGLREAERRELMSLRWVA